jgi:carboxymethylenebutenolidase
MRRSRALVLATMFLAACTLQRWQPEKAAFVDDHMLHMTAAEMRAPVITAPSTSQGTPGLPASNVNAPARLAASPRHGEWVKLAWEPGSKDSLMAWIVYPMKSGNAPVVVVVHEIFGLSTWVRGVADQLAADGFIAIAPDLFSRARGGPSTVEMSGDSARKFSSAVDFTERNKGIMAVANYAMSQPSAEKRFGVVGFCWGGSTAWAAAVYNGKGFGGAVAFYGAPYNANGAVIVDSLAKIQAPVIMLNGSLDARTGAFVPLADEAMRKLGKSFEGKDYEGAVHGFMRAQDDPVTGNTPPASMAANLAAAKEAWPKTIAFFKKNLGMN